MEKINRIIAFIKKHRLAIGLVLVLIIGYFISNLPGAVQRPFVTTVPITPVVTPTPFDAESYSQSFIAQRQIKISDRLYVFAVTPGRQLVWYLGDEPFPLTSGLTVVDYVAQGGSLVYEAGIFADPDNAYYLINLSNKTQTKLNTTPYKPIIGYALDPRETTLAFLGKYSARDNSVNLYLYDLSSHRTTQAATDLSVNSLSWLDDRFLLLNTKVDTPTQINFFISVYSISDNDFPLQDIPALDRSVVYDGQRRILYFINAENNNLVALDLENYVFTDILNLKALPTEVIFNPANGTLVLLTRIDNQITLRFVDPAQKRITRETTLQLEPDEVYIEHFSAQNSTFIKTYNRDTKEYIVQYLPL